MSSVYTEEIDGKTWTITIRSEEEGDLHYSLCDAAAKGDVEKFKSLATNASQDDLDWACELCKSLPIAKLLAEVYSPRNPWLGIAYQSVQKRIAEAEAQGGEASPEDLALKDYLEKIGIVCE